MVALSILPSTAEAHGQSVACGFLGPFQLPAVAFVRFYSALFAVTLVRNGKP